MPPPAKARGILPEYFDDEKILHPINTHCPIFYIDNIPYCGQRCHCTMAFDTDGAGEADQPPESVRLDVLGTASST